MDLNTVAGYRFARTRADLALAPGERFVAGGTWVFAEPQEDARGLVDLTTMGWPAITETPAGALRVAATCTIGELAEWPAAPPLFRQCARALLSSWKVQSVATVGGNICRAYAAAAMVTLCVALDGVAEVWTPGGGAYRRPVADLAVGNGVSALRPGEVLRAVELPRHAWRARTGFRKIALTALGRSGAVLTGRVDDDGAAVFSITAATEAPVVLRYPTLPRASALRADVRDVPGYYSDALGAADWRRAVSAVLAEEIRAELTG